MEITNIDIELAKRAINLENFRITTGMACFALEGNNVLCSMVVLNKNHLTCRETNSQPQVIYAPTVIAALKMQVYPLLKAPSTRGCLLELVREAWNLSTLSCTYKAEKKLWEVSFFVSQLSKIAIVASGATEEEALLNALEMATK
jgi:hypothetical protein